MSDKDGLEEARQDFVKQWKDFAKEMDKEGPFFLGKEPSLIDFVVAPWAVGLLTSLNSSLTSLDTFAGAPLGIRSL